MYFKYNTYNFMTQTCDTFHTIYSVYYSAIIGIRECIEYTKQCKKFKFPTSFIPYLYDIQTDEKTNYLNVL